MIFPICTGLAFYQYGFPYLHNNYTFNMCDPPDLHMMDTFDLNNLLDLYHQHLSYTFFVHHLYHLGLADIIGKPIPV